MLAIIDKEFEELKQFMDYLNEFDLNMTYYEKLEVFNGLVMLATMVSAVADLLSVIILPTSSFVQSFFGANNPSIRIALSFGR